MPVFKKKANKTQEPVQLSEPQDTSLDEDLLAQLDARDKALSQESTKSPSTVNANTTGGSSQASKLQKPKKDSKLRFTARQLRKALVLQSQQAPTDAVTDARLEKEAKDEERDIRLICDQLGLDMHEIQPDGHCLFAAVADQLALHGMLPRATASYPATRAAAAEYMLSHQDDFLPFLPSLDGEDGAGATADGIMSPRQYNQYCMNIRDTGAWGGEPEILALSRAYNVPIHVVQAGKPPVVIHEPKEGMSDLPGAKVAFISYHRRMYGLGEHYNSLRPRVRIQPTHFMAAIH